jgi:IS1 family transposase
MPKWMNYSPLLAQKNRIYLMTIVDRRTSCILAWAVSKQRSEDVLQGMVDEAPQAADYFSDLFATYRSLIYSPKRYTPMLDKSETYRVEGNNAEFRHYLARLARHSRCFSRCIKALRVAIKLFVSAWNLCQLHQIGYPKYTFHVRDFI